MSKVAWSVRVGVAVLAAALSLANAPAQAQSLTDRLDDIQMSLDALQADAAERDDDHSLAKCQAAFARGAVSCMMPRFCAEAISRAATGDTVTCRGYEFTKPGPVGDVARTFAPLPDTPRTFAPLYGEFKSLGSDPRAIVPCSTVVFADTAGAASRQQAARQSVMTYLDAAPDLSGQWRRVNVDPKFLAWLAEIDPQSGCKRQTMLVQAFDLGDIQRTAAFFRDYLKARRGSDYASYRYIPTQQDREEIRACVAASRPDTTAIDCVMPTVSRITSKMMQETGGPQWPEHPSQAAVMIEVAGLKCGMPADDPQAPVPPAAKSCLDAEMHKAVMAIVTALRDYMDSRIQ